MIRSNLAILILKEFHLELRKKSVLSGLLLYLSSTIFIYYLTFSLRQNLINPLVWSALFWVTSLFTAINSVAKSFMGEKKDREIYYYSLLSPASVILSKILYNFLLCLALALTGYMLFILFINNPILDFPVFAATLILTSLGFSSSLTLLSGIASKTHNGHILMAVLGFPVIIGILLMAIRITKNCIDGLESSASADELLLLGAINLLTAAVSYLLFPYIWRS